MICYVFPVFLLKIAFRIMNRIEIEELRVLARSGQHFVERDAVYG